MNVKGSYADNIFVQRLWPAVIYEEVCPKACDNATEARWEVGEYFRFYNDRSRIRHWAI